MAHVAESLHWYTRAGEPAYSVMGLNGKERPTTLRDARKLNLVPSVTTIIKTAAAPGLERWKLDQMLHAALTLPRMTDEKEEDWIARVWTDSQETAKKAKERGIAIHAAIQGSYEGELFLGNDELFFHVDGASKAVDGWVHGQWVAETSFAHPLGFGGKVDLNGAQFGNFADKFVLDFKTKEFDRNDDLRTWDEQQMQLAAYREGLEMPTARCAICYVSVTNPGLSRLIEIPEEELQKGWRMFRALLDFWKARAGYESGWETQT